MSKSSLLLLVLIHIVDRNLESNKLLQIGKEGKQIKATVIKSKIHSIAYIQLILKD